MQINHFTNNTHFTPPSKGGALGATRLASPTNTQRVGNRHTATAKKTAQLLLNEFIIEFSTPGKQTGAVESLIGDSLDKLLLSHFRKQIDSGNAFKLEAKLLKRLLALVPQELRERSVMNFSDQRRIYAIAVGTVSPEDEFSDPVVKYLTRVVTGKRTKGKKAQ